MQLVTACKFEFTELIDRKINGLRAAFLVNAACLSTPPAYSLTPVGRIPPFLLVYLSIHCSNTTTKFASIVGRWDYGHPWGIKNSSYSSTRYYLFIVQKPGQGSTTTTAISNTSAGSLGTPSKRRGWDRWAVSKTTSPIQKRKCSVFTPTSERSAAASHLQSRWWQLLRIVWSHHEWGRWHPTRVTRWVLLMCSTS